MTMFLNLLLMITVAETTQPGTVPEPENVIVELHQDEFFRAIGIQATRAEVTEFGMMYATAGTVDGVTLSHIILAVHPTVELAGAGFKHAAKHMPSQPAEGFPNVGDESLGWISTSGQAGTVLIRTDNATMMVRWSGPPEKCQELASRLVDLLRDDENVARKGRFAELPSLDDVGLPPSVNGGETIPLKPVTRGVERKETASSGNAGAVQRWLVKAPSNSNLVRGAGDQIAVEVPPVSGQLQVTVVFIDARNVMISRQAELTVHANAANAPSQ